MGADEGERRRGDSLRWRRVAAQTTSILEAKFNNTSVVEEVLPAFRAQSHWLWNIAQFGLLSAFFLADG